METLHFPQKRDEDCAFPDRRLHLKAILRVEHPVGPLVRMPAGPKHFSRFGVSLRGLERRIIFR